MKASTPKPFQPILSKAIRLEVTEWPNLGSLPKRLLNELESRLPRWKSFCLLARRLLDEVQKRMSNVEGYTYRSLVYDRVDEEGTMISKY
jgi:hypothetical protein